MNYSPISVQNPDDQDNSSKMQAHHLRRIVEELCTHLDRVTLPQAEECSVNAPMQKQVRAVIRARRAREQYFDALLFADPAWDMLLELFATDLGNQRMSVSGLCAVSAVPATTALRWIRTLEERNLIVRAPDPLDARRTFLTLSRTAYSAMAALFASAGAQAII
jgi:DNA-binding MarR family transcriptional regulator